MSMANAMELTKANAPLRKILRFLNTERFPNVSIPETEGGTPISAVFRWISLSGSVPHLSASRESTS
jgi:hypothetical protein